MALNFETAARDGLLLEEVERKASQAGLVLRAIVLADPTGIFAKSKDQRPIGHFHRCRPNG